MKDARAKAKLAKASGGSISHNPLAKLGIGAGAPAINAPSELQIQTLGTGDEEMLNFDSVAVDGTESNSFGGANKDVFRRLTAAPRTRRAHSPRGEIGGLTMQSSILSEAPPQWQMVHDTRDAHKSPVFAMTSVGNQLYSAAARSLRIWDVGSMRLLSDLTEKVGVIKAIAFWKERNLLMTAAEKNIMMWDVVSLTNIAIYKGIKEEIKALHFVPEKELLFAASKGSS